MGKGELAACAALGAFGRVWGRHGSADFSLPTYLLSFLISFLPSASALPLPFNPSFPSLPFPSISPTFSLLLSSFSPFTLCEGSFHYGRAGPQDFLGPFPP